MPYSVVEVIQHLGGTYQLHLQCRRAPQAISQQVESVDFTTLHDNTSQMALLNAVKISNPALLRVKFFIDDYSLYRWWRQ
jgi:hypothetical protein